MPTNFTQNDRQSLLNALQLGRSNAIGAKRLALLISFPVGGNQVKLRSLIKECIEQDGDLIGAATGKPAGFFLINTEGELNKYLDSLRNRTISDNDRRSALINKWNSIHPLTSRTILTIT